MQRLEIIYQKANILRSLQIISDEEEPWELDLQGELIKDAQY